MREILFRAIDEGTQEWVYGYYCEKPSSFHIGKEYSIFDDKTISRYTVHPETVGQYIGVEDKNGNKVFEGDILRYTPRPKCTIYYKVIWNQEWSRFALVQWSTHKYQLYEWAEFSKVKYSCEVFGNIHDYPDLLESLESN